MILIPRQKEGVTVKNKQYYRTTGHKLLKRGDFLSTLPLCYGTLSRNNPGGKSMETLHVKGEGMPGMEKCKPRCTPALTVRKPHAIKLKTSLS